MRSLLKDNSGFMLLDLMTSMSLNFIISLIITSIIIGASFIVKESVVNSIDTMGIIILDTAIYNDTLRGNNITFVNGQLNINGSIYRNINNRVKREYNGSTRRLSNGEITVKTGNGFMEVILETGRTSFKRRINTNE